MALAVVKSGPATLDERLASARRAEIAPRKRVAELAEALTAAVDEHDYATADKLQPQLQAAREELALAEVEARILAEAAAAIEAELAAQREAIAKARDVDAAREERDRCLAARTQAQEASAATRALIPGAMEALQKLIAEALGFDQQAAAASASATAAMVRTGERAPGSGSHVPEPTKSLLDRDEVLRGVKGWTGAGLPAWMVGLR